MASLQQRGKIYYIVFSKRIEDKLLQKKFSLGTSDLKKANNLKYDFEKQYELGRIDPFNRWTPKQETEKIAELMEKAGLNTSNEKVDKFISHLESLTVIGPEVGKNDFEDSKKIEVQAMKYGSNRFRIHNALIPYLECEV